MTAPTTVPRNSIGDRAFDWWKQNCALATGDPGVRARLRRCHSPLDAAMIPEAIQLARRLGALKPSGRSDDARVVHALDLARVLAHIKETDSTAPMRVAGWKSFPADRKESDAGDARPTLAESRFQRLLQAEDGEERVTAFTRLIALLGDKANVARIAEDFWYWNDRTKHRWAFEYYAAAVAVPADDFITLEENEA